MTLVVELSDDWHKRSLPHTSQNFLIKNEKDEVCNEHEVCYEVR